MTHRPGDEGCLGWDEPCCECGCCPCGKEGDEWHAWGCSYFMY